MTSIDRQQGPNNLEASVRGVASGVLFVAFFSTLWAMIGIEGLQGWGGLWLTLVAFVVGLAFLSGGISLLRAGRRLPDQAVAADAGRGTRKWFRIIFATEGILIVAAAVICNAAGRFDLFFPVMALIVGVHFLPLAALFKVKVHYLAGALLCLLAIITLLVVPERARLGGFQIAAWWVILGFSAAVILWGDGLALWLQGKRLLARRNRVEA